MGIPILGDALIDTRWISGTGKDSVEGMDPVHQKAVDEDAEDEQILIHRPNMALGVLTYAFRSAVAVAIFRTPIDRVARCIRYLERIRVDDGNNAAGSDKDIFVVKVADHVAGFVDALDHDGEIVCDSNKVRNLKRVEFFLFTLVARHQHRELVGVRDLRHRVAEKVLACVEDFGDWPSQEDVAGGVPHGRDARHHELKLAFKGGSRRLELLDDELRTPGDVEYVPFRTLSMRTRRQ